MSKASFFKPRIRRLLKQILSLPTAPFHEKAVSDFVRRHLELIGVMYRMDRYGNIVAHLKRGNTLPTPLALVAHMDHPGFYVEDVEDTIPRKQMGWRANARARVRILGGVGKISKGQHICFFSTPRNGSGEIIRIAKRDSNGTPTHVDVRLRELLVPGAFGAWDVPAFRRRGKKIYARAIDDVCGVAVMLEVLSRLQKIKSTNLNLYCCFTRAEEVGFVGAAALATQHLLPKSTKIISIEMSKELPGKAEQGKGFVVRIGDRATIFEPTLIGFMIRLARNIQSRKPNFRFQAAVLDGGACEATLFNARRYKSAGVALPLRNYHNRTPSGGIGMEYVDERDLQSLIEFLIELPKKMETWGEYEKRLRARLEKNFMDWRKRLLSSA